MECMPEIPGFEETLGSVDKTQPIEDRVRYVLDSMGLKKKKAQEQQEIFEVANTAVRIREITWDNIFSKLKVPMGFRLERRMNISTFINDFVSQYDSDKKVQVLDFLKELQKIVMNENEIGNYPPYSN